MSETEESRRNDRLTPRVLLLDMTRIGDATATGELKATLFAGWPRSAFMQVYIAGRGTLGVYSNGRENAVASEVSAALHAIEKLAQDFDPEVILYRPAPRTAELHQVAMHLIDRLRIPLVTWIMDDWPTAYAAEDRPAAAPFINDWRKLLSQSVARLSISDAMSEAFRQRYEHEFTAIANGVDPADWPSSLRREDGVLKVRYAGSLAENMTLASIVKVAHAVEQLAERGVNIQFEIKTRDMWRRLAEPHLKHLKHTSFIVADLQPAEYRAWLAGAQISVIAYNFDDASRRYIQYSLANKLPECLASGAPLLAIGPRDVATIATLEKYDAAMRVSENSVDAIVIALDKLASTPEMRRAIGERGQQIAFEHFNIFTARQRLSKVLTAAARQPSHEFGDLTEEDRDAGAHVDETAVVARILADQRGHRHVMIDVGAHFGTSAAYFNELGWTVHCYEPDPKNRAKLNERFAGVETVSIDPRAVSDRPSCGVAFFTSQESTGISGLSAFHETHEETGRVDVTTVEEIIRERSITAINFLKIDVEGFDFSVLKGVPWRAMRPDVIECEFEDAKTKPMGHSWRDVAQYLVERSYTVYISEWHPIIRYGIPHDWRRIIPYTDKMHIPDDAWGNLLAFKADPGLRVVRDAFAALRKRRDVSALNAASGSALPMDSDQNPVTLRRPFYASAAERLQQRSPRLFSIGRLVRRALAGMWRRRLMFAVAAVIFGFMVFVGLAQPTAASRIVITGGVVLLAIIAMVFCLGSWTYHRVRALSMETASLRAALTRTEKAVRANVEMNRLELHFADHDASLSELKMQVSTLLSRTENIVSELDARAEASDELEQIIAELDEDLNSLGSDLEAAQRTASKSEAQIDILRQRYDALSGAIKTAIEK